MERPNWERARMVRRVGRLLWVFIFLTHGAGGDQLRFDSAREWRQWQLPLDAVELTDEGIVRAATVGKNINAALNCGRFGGGIRSAGSNPETAALVLDGDPTTGWRPDWWR